ncbi:MAG: VOC family protein [Succinatimonas hippei]|nr:VOC family protein [Succinatimonas hippei]
MVIEHIAMYVNELERTREFFTDYFGAKAGALYFNQKTGLRSYFLSFDQGSRLEIMTRPGLEDPKKHHVRTGYIHIAFKLGSKEKVDELTARMRHDGYEILSGPRVTGDGYYESSVVAIEGNLIEITA